MQNISSLLQQQFGFEQFREGQEQTVKQLLAGESSLAIFPTGAGKSLCYQFTALQLPHLTLVVSPLLALMKDQLAFLTSKGIAAASIDSSLSPAENQQVMNDVRSNKLKILMVSVERFKNERFRHFISSVSVSMLVVDEAHCISEWGHNFRPDYLKLPHYQQSLNIPLTLLLTATATKKVKQDMAAKFAIKTEHIVQTGFYRPNLHLEVLPVNAREKNNALVDQIKAQQGCGIVYVTLQQSAEQVADFLQSQGVNAQAYHAGFEDTKRQKIQQDFMNNQIQVIVATIAFGMGIDKADIRFVIHYDLPKSIENYSQEIGRAGRDGDQARCITLANLDGLTTVENFVYGDTPEPAGIKHVLNTINSETQNGRWEMQGLSLSTASNIKQLPLKTLLVQLELQGVIQPLFSYFADFKYKFNTPEADIISRFSGERGQFLKAVFRYSQKKKVWAEPDFEALFQHYQSDRQRVITALEYLAEQQLISLETKKITDVYQVNSAGLQADGLAEQLSDYFAEKETSEIKRIATLVRFFELSTCLSFNLSRYFDDQQTPRQCGHCSVCQNQVAKLTTSERATWPDDVTLIEQVNAFALHMKNHKVKQLSLTSCCHFLTGLTMPMFNRKKVKELSGFALCQQHRYQEVKDKLTALSAQLIGVD
ncbi:RecQ family ATP-dependent DNA helicase [Thalassotalea sp. PLHSN55]|uniref:RecQ family ATP-dependent DNA helicase n=1 Tax=Thalassotalea sp. PLHSN55 TaxID=3435888 RepID=UPI003F851484